MFFSYFRIKRQKCEDGDRIIRQDINDLLRIRLELDIKVGRPHCYCFQEAFYQNPKKSKPYFVCRQLTCAFFKWAEPQLQGPLGANNDNQGELMMHPDQNGMVTTINNMNAINVEGTIDEMHQLQMQNNINVEKQGDEYAQETGQDPSLYEQVDPNMKNESVQQ